jgi:signal peptidase I
MTMPPEDSQTPKGPWLYSGAQQSPVTPSYVPPTGAPSPDSSPGSPSGTPAAPSPSAASPAAVPPSPPARSAVAAPEKKPDPSLAGIIDTIEAIIIALILALTFRAFIVEAFVIPTGSMAPTLLGAHFKIICPKCGYEFDRDAELAFQYRDADKAIINVGQRSELSSNTNIPADDYFQAVCPNCMNVIAYNEMPQYLGTRTVLRDDRGGRGPGPVPFAMANNGDRILVLKYLYALLPPQRWDVIVFKEPQHAQDNYIKRLIGLPGETVEIINGDIYIAPPGAGPSPADRVIARKPPAVQKAVWQLVYDNDFYPTDEGLRRVGGIIDVWQNPWSAETPGWSVKGPIIHFTPASAADGGSLRFVPREPYGLNVLGYNNDVQDLLHPNLNTEPLMRVGDLRLETTWLSTADDPALSLTAGLPSNCVQVRWGKEGVSLYHLVSREDAKPVFEPMGTPVAFAAPLKQKPYHVALENVDHSARVFIDGKLVLNVETPWTAQDARRQAVADRADSSPEQLIRVELSGPGTLSHLKLFRDLYYTQSRHDSPRTANTDRPLTLGPDEFFPLGDNSRKSSDGRYWNEVYPALDDLGTREGVVPRRYLLGKAFFVYWPSGYPALPSSAFPSLSNLPLVPNTGDMRLIR